MTPPTKPPPNPPRPLRLPPVDAGWPAFLHRRVEDQLAAARASRAALLERPNGDVGALESWNEVRLHLRNASAASSLLAEVHPDPDVREAAEAGLQAAHGFSTDLLLDAEVHERLASIAGRDLAALPEGADRVLAHALRDFRRAGVDRDEPTRARLRELQARQTELAQTFARHVRDGKRRTTVPASALAGLPPDWVAEHPVETDQAHAGGVVTLTSDYPDTMPFLTFSRDARARRAVLRSHFDVGWPDNDAVLGELLALRREQAQLLGYPDWPTYDAEPKMVEDGDAIGTFIERLTAAADASGRRDLARLRERAARDGEDDPIDSSGWRYWSEVLRREELGVDAQQVRRYFAFDKVRRGLLDVTSRLFGVTYAEVPDATGWHEDVATHDVLLDDRRIGRIHLDLHPREGKYNHAAQFDLTPGVLGRQLAEGVLVCNLPRGLMEHGDVVTLFHEFGHLLHHVLAGRHPWADFSGVATEWDFVEAPSQLLEEWAWDPTVLATFATDEDGEPVPADLVRRMKAAEDFGRGFLARQQMFYAAVSYRFHLEVPEDLTARLHELATEYNLIRLPESVHFHCGFSHLEGYSSAYYTYMWSLVIAKDLFSAFDPADLLAPEVAHRYRDRVIAPGGSRDAADLVAAFLGRGYDARAFEGWLSG